MRPIQVRAASATDTAARPAAKKSASVADRAPPPALKAARACGPTVPIAVGRQSWPIAKLAAGPTIDLVYGNPPCAAWSQAGAAMTEATKAAKDWRKDDRVDCTRLHFSLLEELRPHAWVWESVTGAFTKGREFVDELTERAVALGYNVTYVLHDAKWLGVPQMRKRFFFVATDVRFDVDTSKISWEIVPCAEALAALKGEQSPAQEHNIRRYQDWLHEVIPGEDLRRTWERLNPPETWKRHPNGFVKGRPPFTIKRPRPDGPANTVMHEMVHPVEHRAMSIPELALLCGFPLDYRCPFGSSNDHSLVARGVCPPVAKWIAGEVARS